MSFSPKLSPSSWVYISSTPTCVPSEHQHFDIVLASDVMMFVQSHLNRVSVEITQLKWSRIQVRGQPHKHSFVRDGEEKRFTSVVVDATKGIKNVSATLESGIKDLLVLKSTESSFENVSLHSDLSYSETC